MTFIKYKLEQNAFRSELILKVIDYASHIHIIR